jgi:Amidohydrolase family
MGGLEMYPPEIRLDRLTALRLWTQGSAWFSNEAGSKGRIAPGRLADLIVLSDDYLTVDESQIRRIESVLTLVGGRVVHGAGVYQGLAPPLPPAAPDWSPVGAFGGYQQAEAPAAGPRACHDGCASACNVHGHAHAWATTIPADDPRAFWGALGCSCWAV